LSKYKVEYTVDGDYYPDWEENNKFNDGTGDGMILVPFDTSVLGDRRPFRIPKDAKVTEVADSGYYLSRETGSLWRRLSDHEDWQRYDTALSKWVNCSLDDEIEWIKKYSFEKLDMNFSDV